MSHNDRCSRRRFFARCASLGTGAALSEVRRAAYLRRTPPMASRSGERNAGGRGRCVLTVQVNRCSLPGSAASAHPL